MGSKYFVDGLKELEAKLDELASPKEQAATLRASVRDPMKAVKVKAEANITSFSPGETELHRTYKGRLVTMGFAGRSIRLIVKLNKLKTMAQAILGVRAEAFYALAFFELGTSRIAKKPWLTPAFESSVNEAIKGVGDVMRKRIERIAKKRAKGK